MLVKMLETFRVSPNGINVETVHKGQQIELPLDTAQGLIRDKLAVEVKSGQVTLIDDTNKNPDDNKKDKDKNDTSQDTKQDSKNDNKKA